MSAAEFGFVMIGPSRLIFAAAIVWSALAGCKSSNDKASSEQAPSAEAAAAETGPNTAAEAPNVPTSAATEEPQKAPADVADDPSEPYLPPKLSCKQWLSPRQAIEQLGPGKYVATGQETPHDVSCFWGPLEGKPGGTYSFDLACGAEDFTRWKRGEWPRGFRGDKPEPAGIGKDSAIVSTDSGGVKRVVLAFESARIPGCGISLDGPMTVDQAKYVANLLDRSLEEITKEPRNDR